MEALLVPDRGIWKWVRESNSHIGITDINGFKPHKHATCDPPWRKAMESNHNRERSVRLATGSEPSSDHPPKFGPPTRPQSETDRLKACCAVHLHHRGNGRKLLSRGRRHPRYFLRRRTGFPAQPRFGCSAGTWTLTSTVKSRVCCIDTTEHEFGSPTRIRTPKLNSFEDCHPSTGLGPWLFPQDSDLNHSPYEGGALTIMLENICLVRQRV